MTDNNKKIGYWAIYAGVILLLILVDQATKYWALHFLKDAPSIVWIPGVFELQYLENRGAAFGLFQNQKWFFVASAILVFFVVTWIYNRIPRTRKYLPLQIISMLTVAGAIGNVIDRLYHGFVVDFFYFSLIDFPIFNVADIYVVVACAALAVFVLFYYKDDHDFDFLSVKKAAGKADE